METRDSAVPKHCYQCGAAIELILDGDAAESGWFVCHRCGERIISISDVATLARHAEERTVRDKLGVEQFLASRRVQNEIGDD